MKILIATYYSKIVFTVIVWCLPLLFFPNLVLTAFDIQEPVVSYFLRLLGWAYFALCVGYFVGLVNAKNGILLMAPIWAGIISNSGAAILLTVLVIQTYQSLQWMMTLAVAVSALGAGLVSFKLLKYGVFNKSEAQKV